MRYSLHFVCLLICMTGQTDDPFLEATTVRQPLTTHFPPSVLGTTPTIVDNAGKLDEFINQLVTIKGPISGGKIPRILGVEVARADDLAVPKGEEWFAVGILRSFDPTQKPVPRGLAIDSLSAKRYVLYTDLQGKIAVSVRLRTE